MIETFNLMLSFLTLIMGIGLILGIVALLVLVILKKKKIVLIIKNMFMKHGAWMIFLISLIATLGSLFFSEIAGYNPCKLCWYQRLFMYPLVLISIVMIWKKTKELLYVILPMAVIGAIIAGYHYTIQFLPAVLSCVSDGVNCAAKEFLTYGYITIPMMALTAFIAITLISLMMIFSKKK